MSEDEKKEEIIFIGDFNAFKIEGAKVYKAENIEEAEEILNKLKNKECIIILAERLWRSEKIRDMKRKGKIKILLMHDAKEKKGEGMKALKELIARATGIVLKEE